MTTGGEKEEIEEKPEIVLPQEETKQEIQLSPPAVVSFSGLNSLRQSMQKIDENHMAKDNQDMDESMQLVNSVFAPFTNAN